LTHRENALLVHGMAEGPGADPHLGPQLPHADFGVALAFGDLDARHCDPPQSIPRTLVGFVQAMRLISASVMPSANSASAYVCSPAAGCGFTCWPKSVPSVTRSTPTARIVSIIWATLLVASAPM